MSSDDLLSSLRLVQRKASLNSFQDGLTFFLQHLRDFRLSKLNHLFSEQQTQLKEQVQLALEALELNLTMREEVGSQGNLQDFSEDEDSQYDEENF